jgi:hypothetical protein
MKPVILFVYNANTDPVSVMVDYAHKVFKPSTYKCELCALTHHNLGERSAWKSFKKRTNADLTFMYLRQYEKAYTERYTYPVILRKTDAGFEILLDKVELKALNDVESLIKKLEMKMNKF